MRAAWIVLAVVELAGCSSGDGHDGEPAGRGGSGGVAGALATSGGAGAVGASGSGGTTATAGSSGHVGGSPAQAEAGMGDEPSEAGAPESGAGGQAGMPTADAGAPDALGGQPGHGVSGAGSGSGGRHPKGGSGGAPPSCDCDAAHDCIDGACVIKPECDCEALKVECGPLSAAMRVAFACPTEVQCGDCGTAALCVGTNDPEKYGRRLCVSPAEAACHPWTTYEEGPGYPPICPPAGGDARCSVAYAGCTPVSLPDGTVCPEPDFDQLPNSRAVYCGPPL
jgi:hypothetical protein